MLSLQIDLQSLEDAWVGHTSQKYSFGKLYFGKFNLEIEIWMLLVIALRKYMTSRGLLTVQRHRHSWNLKDYGQPTKYRAAGVGARGAYASKNFTFVTVHLHLGIVEPLRPLMEKQNFYWNIKMTMPLLGRWQHGHSHKDGGWGLAWDLISLPTDLWTSWLALCFPLKSSYLFNVT